MLGYAAWKQAQLQQASRSYITETSTDKSCPLSLQPVPRKVYRRALEASGKASSLPNSVQTSISHFIKADSDRHNSSVSSLSLQLQQRAYPARSLNTNTSSDSSTLNLGWDYEDSYTSQTLGTIPESADEHPYFSANKNSGCKQGL